MFRQMKVDLVGMVENMSYFVCPHCHQETDIFSRGGAEKTASQFGVAYLGAVQLDPAIRKASDGGQPMVLAGEDSSAGKIALTISLARLWLEWMRSSQPPEKA